MTENEKMTFSFATKTIERVSWAAEKKAAALRDIAALTKLFDDKDARRLSSDIRRAADELAEMEADLRNAADEMRRVLEYPRCVP